MKYLIFAGIERPYGKNKIVKIKSFDSEEEAKDYAIGLAVSVYTSYELYDSALISKADIERCPEDFNITSVPGTDEFEVDVDVEYSYQMVNWLDYSVFPLEETSEENYLYRYTKIS